MGRRKRRKRTSGARAPARTPARVSPSPSFHRWLGVVALVALAVRACHVYVLNRAPFAHLLLGDAESYHAWAMRLVSSRAD